MTSYVEDFSRVAEIAVGPEMTLGEPVSDEENQFHASQQQRRFRALVRRRKEFQRTTSENGPSWTMRLRHDALMLAKQMHELESLLVERNAPDRWRPFDDDEENHILTAFGTAERIDRECRPPDPWSSSARGTGSSFARNASVSRRSDEPIQPSNNRQRKEDDNAN